MDGKVVHERGKMREGSREMDCKALKERNRGSIRVAREGKFEWVRKGDQHGWMDEWMDERTSVGNGGSLFRKGRKAKR